MTLAEVIKKAKERQQELIANMNDNVALVYYKVFPEWKAGTEYEAGQRVRHNDVLWRVKQTHMSESEPVEGEMYEKVVRKEAE